MPGDTLPDDALAYLHAVRPHARTDLWCCIYDREASEVDRAIHQLVIPRGRAARFLTDLNARNYGIFVAQSDFRAARRTVDEVTFVPTIWVDYDGAEPPLSYALEPHALVETSPPKFQAIWRVDGLPQDHDTHSRLIVALAHHYGADDNCAGINRVLRVPGFLHCKREPVRSRLVSAHHGPAYTLDQVLEAWPFLRDALAQPAPTHHATSTTMPSNLTGYVRAALDAELAQIERAGDDQRNATITVSAFNLGTLVGAGVLDEAATIDLVVDAYVTSGGKKPTNARRWATRSVKAGARHPRNLDGVHT